MKKIDEKLSFWVFYIGIPGSIPKSKVPKCVCRSTLASFCNEPTLFAIFGPARGQIYGKTGKKIVKKMKEKLHFLAFYIGIPIGCGDLEFGGFGVNGQSL